jgi:C_GCAxxG_C_C family probable redox protein
MQSCDYYVDRAAQLREQGYNCAQSVACAFSDEVALDAQQLFQLTEGFGGGMGGKDGTCGAISGAVVILSLLTSKSDPLHPTKQETYQRVRQVFDTFVRTTGSSVCRELQGLDGGEVLASCDRCVELAVRFTYQELSNPVSLLVDPS